MALTNEEKQEIIETVFITILAALNNPKCKIKSQDTDYHTKTIRRLYAYPLLKRNVKKAEQDIEDLFKEEFKTCPAVHHAMEYYGEGCTVDEVRYVKKLLIEKDMYRDLEEIHKIDTALIEIQDDVFSKIIPWIFFENMPIDKITTRMYCNRATVYRHKKRLIDKLTICLYGADVLA